MSHTTRVKSIAIRDKEAVRDAVKELQSNGVNCELIEGNGIYPRMYYPSQQKEILEKGQCDMVLKLHDSKYDVGFEQQEDGSYSPVFDNWSGHIKKQIGAKCGCENEDGQLNHIGGFMQLYAKHAAINTAHAQGYKVDSVNYNETTGEYQLEINVDSYN